MASRAFDVIIVGAGSVGTPLAWQLAAAGLKTLVIDQFASVGQGSNKAAIGGIRATHSDLAKIRIGLRSIEIVSTWKARYGDDLAWLQGGYCFVAYRAREEAILKGLLVIQQRQGLDTTWLDKEALLSLIPALNPIGLLGSTFSPGDGSASPLLAALAFERQAKEHGAVFVYGETVTAILRDHDRVRGVVTDKGSYSANVVVNAAGPWARPIAALVDIELPVQAESHEAGISEPVAPFLRPMVVDLRSVSGSANFYFYQHATGQVVFCLTPDPPVLGTDRRETSDFLPQIAPRLIAVVPMLKHLKVRRTWRGLYPMTSDGMPIVGPANGLTGYLNAAGMCGQGFMLGPGLAVYLRRLITEDVDEETLTVLSQLALERKPRVAEALK